MDTPSGFPGVRRGLRIPALIPALASVALLACGSDAPTTRPDPAPSAVRDFYGLGPGSCWRYRFSAQGAALFATASISGPNTAVVAGETVYLRTFQLDSGGRPEQHYFDTEVAGEVRLLRHDTSDAASQRVTFRYDVPPVLARFELDPAGKLRFLEDRIDTDTTPVEGEPERHVWSVLGREEVSTPAGPAEAIKLEHRLTRGAAGETSIAQAFLVPGQGFARLVDFAGTTYQVCAQRVCDSTGACTGAPDCATLACP
jgi:hypothetical protein